MEHALELRRVLVLDGVTDRAGRARAACRGGAAGVPIDERGLGDRPGGSSGRPPAAEAPTASVAFAPEPDERPSTSATVLPRSAATSSGRRSDFRPATVAATRLTGLLVPSDFVRMSRIPASSSTARTPPPAMTPVPSRGRLQEHLARAGAAEHLVGDRVAVLRHAEEVLLRVLDRLLDRHGDLLGLPVADADRVHLVAHDDEGREREAPAALDDLGDAVDLHDALVELEPVAG